MWVKIEIVSRKGEFIYMPWQLAMKFYEDIAVVFGKKVSYAFVMTSRDLKMSGGESIENPLKIKISSNLASRLCLCDAVPYQIKHSSSRLVIGPTIGLLLGGHNYAYSAYHMKKYSDRFGIYDQVGGLIYAFSNKSIDWKKKEVYGLYYDYTSSNWIYGKFPFPSVVYRRDFHTDPVMEKKLTEVTKGKMFNAWRFTKYFLYEHFKKDKRLYDHLPATEITQNYEQIKKFIDANNDIILKPINLSRGRGICIINKVGEVYKVFDYRNGGAFESEISNDENLKEFFEVNEEFFHDYLIQTHLKLAKIDGASFDIRVVMQKETLSDWKCTGIECRVAAKDTLVTNISRGGYALPLDDALKGAFPEQSEEQERIKEQLFDLCQKICKSLERTGHHYAEFGMDIAADDQGRLWIIEVNVFPSFKGFKTMSPETYADIRHTPILYAARLAGFETSSK